MITHIFRFHATADSNSPLRFGRLRKLPLIFLLLVMVATTSCSLVFDEVDGDNSQELQEEGESKAASSSAISRNKSDFSETSGPGPGPGPGRRPTSSQQPLDTVEITWEIPSTPAEGFILDYKISGEESPHRVHLPSDKLSRVDDPTHGYVFRYFLEGIPPDRTVSATITAYDGDNLSLPSEIIEVPPRLPPARRTRPVSPPQSTSYPQESEGLNAW